MKLSVPGKQMHRIAVLIQEGATRQLSNGGWSSMMFHHVANEVGLSVRPIRERYESRGHLGADVWRNQLRATFISAVNELVDATDNADSQGLAKAIASFIQPNQNMRAISELLAVATFESLVREAIHETIVSGGWFVAPTSKLQSARRAYILSWALGALFLSRDPNADVPNLDAHIERLSESLSVNIEPTVLPKRNAAHLDAPARFGTNNEAWENLLHSTMSIIGEVGFEAATVRQIARKSGRSEGLLFSHYSNKRELFADVALRSATMGLAANENYQRRLQSQFSLGLVEAIVIYEFMKPTRQRIRSFYIEQLRVAWHDSELGVNFRKVTDEFLDSQEFDGESSKDYVFAEKAIGIGVLVMATVYPDSAKLPFQVVTVPLLG